jgi:hypothetical protein
MYFASAFARGEVPAVSSVAFQPLERACFAPSPAVVLPAPLLAVKVCLSTSTLWVHAGDDDTWGEHRPPTAGSWVFDFSGAVTSFLFSLLFMIVR